MPKELREIMEKKVELRAKMQDENCDLDAIEKELNELEERQAKIEKRQELAKKLGNGELVSIEVVKPVEKRQDVDSENIAESKEYRSAWLKSLQGVALNEAEQRAMTTATGSVGAVVPTQTLNQIIEKLKQNSIVLPLVTVLHIPSNVIMPVEGVNNDADVVAEGASATDKADTMGALSLTAYKLIKTISLTAEVQAMSIDAFEAFIVAQLAKKIGRLVDNLIINGTGSSQPTGIMTAVEAIETSETTGFGYDDLMDLLGKLGSGYARNAVLMAKRSFIYGTIAKIKDSNKQPIFKMETDGKFEGKLLGYPVIANDDVPADNIIFGDFGYYFFNFVKDPTVESDKSVGFRSGDVCYRAMALGDGNVGLDEAFVVMAKKSGA